MVEVQICEVDASAMFIGGFGLFSIFGFPWLHHIPTSADVTTRTNACNLQRQCNYIKLKQINKLE
jgi:hypothetical protein